MSKHWHNDGWDWVSDEDQSEGSGIAVEATIWAISLVEVALACWILFW